MVAAAHRTSRFLSVESCGQCPPCKIGSGEITAHLERIEAGDGTDDDLVAIGGWLQRVTDGNRCDLPVQERLVVSSILRAFPEELTAHVEQHQCPNPGPRPLPRLIDLADGRATHDEADARKRPGWTYAET